MEIAYFNGRFVSKSEISISPDDRGFLFADGIYEVAKWYGGFFYDMDSHVTRLKRSLSEIQIKWDRSDSFSSFATELIRLNGLDDKHAMVYLQVTRGASPRSHSFPFPEVAPTIYAFVKELYTTGNSDPAGIKVMLKEDIRWSRCDIKSIALLANTISFQEAHEKGSKECIFVRNGLITEGSRSNIFLLLGGILYTHPESQYILSGITRKNILRIAAESGIPVKEEPLSENLLGKVTEAFITNTTGEVIPVVKMNDLTIGNGQPGPVTNLIHIKFHTEIANIKG
jgi:D-alanine transaminase